jgi:hypothetical protein
MAKKNKDDKYNPVSKQAPLIKFSDDFWIMLDKIAQVDNSEIAWALYELDSNPIVKNIMRVSEVDLSEKEGRFSVTISGSKVDVRVKAFLKNYFGDTYSEEKIDKFIKAYNKIVGGFGEYEEEEDSESVEVESFTFNPSDIKSTFLSLVTETYPYGHEEEVLKYLPTFLKKDKHGNYYHLIGKSDTAFTCHLDTASRTKSVVNLRETQKDGQTFIKTDGKSILGADDKAGVTVLLYMIHNNVPGVYWFFIGEERGGIGSRDVAKDLSSYSFMSGVKKVVSFDRRNYYSVITSQMGVACCSNEFAQSLCDELNKSGLKLTLDPTGIFTDSASFIDLIPECTNVSVGYFDEHRHTEMQNITYLKSLCKAAVACDWDKLVVKRKIGIDEEVSKKYARMVGETRRLRTNNQIKFSSEEGKLVYNIDIINGELNDFHDDMIKLERLFAQYKQQPSISFNENTIKIKFD